MKKRVGAFFLSLIMLISCVHLPSIAELCQHPSDRIVQVWVSEGVCGDHAGGTGLIEFCGVCGEQLGTVSWSGGPVPAGSYNPSTHQVVLFCPTEGCTASVTLDLHNHVWENPEVTLDPGCTTTGSRIVHCVCGETMDEIIPALGHDWDEGEVTPVPCCEEGVLTHHCSRCEETFVEPISVDGHEWDEGVVTTEPSCDAPGVRTYTCSVCGTTYTEEISAQTHIWELDHVVAPGCATQGYSVYHCSVCGGYRNDDFTLPLGHTWDEGTIIDPASCSHIGEIRFECANCDAFYSEPIPVNEAHNYVETARVPASCAGDGSVTYTCSLCGHVHTEVIPGGHQWVETGRDLPTCVERGIIYYSCANCPATHQEYLPATGIHVFEEYDNDATCTEGGYSYQKCAHCDATFMQPVPALGHEWGEWTVSAEPTCTEPGTETRVCAHGCTEEREIPAIGHDYGDDHRCVHCHETYPEVEEIIAQINALPSASAINENNALAAYNQVLDIEEAIGAITDDDLTEALNLYADLAKLAAVKARCQEYMIHIVYTPATGASNYLIRWNDNQVTDILGLRTPVASFLEASEAKLRYRVVSEDGTVTVASGTLTSMADAAEAFSYLGLSLNQNAPLLEVYAENENYVIRSNSTLPVSYTSRYTDYSTMEQYTLNFRINYSLELENPAPANYVFEGNGNSVILPNNGQASLTMQTEWSIHVDWRDDDNRSAEGGDSTAHTPRVDKETLIASLKLFGYADLFGASSAVELTGDYEIEVSDDLSTITVYGLPAYNENGEVMSYYVTAAGMNAANTDAVPGNRYRTSFFNSSEYMTRGEGVYNRGTLYETLTNTVMFTVNVGWADGLTPAERPNASFYIWRVVEKYDANGNVDLELAFSFPVPDTVSSFPVPTETSSEFCFERTLSGVSRLSFPMYDGLGRRYIYFGRMSGVPGTYSVNIDNTSANVSDPVREAFAATAPNYFLNGASIVNTLGATYNLSVTKVFKALSIQNLLSSDFPISATFLLQIKDENGNWVLADAERDQISYGEGVTIGADNSVRVTLSNFRAENMSQTFSGVSAAKFTSDYQTREFRWIETELSVNGVHATYDPDKWISDGAGGMVYDGLLTMIDGQLSTLLGDSVNRTSGPDNTTAIFRSVSNGSVFTSTLMGSYQVEIKKFFKDENDRDIADDPRLQNVRLTFHVYRNGELFDTFLLTQDDLVSGDIYWEKLMNYDRFDEEGREYRFMLKETGGVPADMKAGEENYAIRVTEYPAGSGMLVRRMVTSYTNIFGESHGTGKLRFEVDKEWLDDSDLESRNPVTITLYRFRNVDGTLLPAPEAVSAVTLNPVGNWCGTVIIWKQPDMTVGDVTYHDDYCNYLMLETSATLEDGHAVPVCFDHELSSEEMAAIRAASEGSSVAVGTLGSNAHIAENWDGLNYLFRTSVRHSLVDEVEFYTVTNLRTATVDFRVEKVWRAGGEVHDSRFGVYREGTLVGNYTLNINPATAEVTVTDIVWFNGYENRDLTITVLSNASIDENGGLRASVLIEGLPKFSESGAHISHSVAETAIFDQNGVAVPVSGGSCVVEGVTYVVGSSVTSTLTSNEMHRSGDLYDCVISNVRTRSYNLVSNKVWRDDMTSDRPDITFAVYRMSTKNPELRALVEAGDTAGMVEFLSDYTGSANLVIADRIWDTQINKYYWTCTIVGMEQFDGYGYPYVYYGVERIADDDLGTIYHGYYSNITMETEGFWPITPEEEDFTTRDVFGISNDLLDPMSGSVFIMSDGVHQSAPGVFSGYYSAAVVNRPEFTMKVSGKKLWKLPEGWDIADVNLPDIQVDLYRTLEKIDFTDAETYSAAILEAATEGSLNTARVSYAPVDSFKYNFEKDAAGNDLQSYDEWGSQYHYYVLETGVYTGGEDETVPEVRNFPAGLRVYDTNNFSNIYSTGAPFAEISIRKEWQLSPEVIARLNEFGLSALTEDDFAPAIVNLYGIPTNADGEEITESRIDFGTARLVPGVYDSDGDGVDDTVFRILTAENGSLSLEALYTFKNFYNSETEEYEPLPYFWMFSYPMNYYLDETHTNGYVETFSGTPVVLDGMRIDANDTIYYNTNANLQHFKNVYDGERTSFSFRKYWNDAYVGNDDYRPDELTFTIRRRIGNVIDPNFEMTAVLRKADFRNVNLWEGTVTDLLKYAPSGALYTYFVAEESITVDSTTVTARANGDVIGNYYVSNHTDTLWTNTLTNGMTISATKSWTVMGTPITAYTKQDYSGFDDLRKFGALPKTVDFIVQRRVSESTAWSNVLASSYEDTIHHLIYNGQDVLGHKVNLETAGANNFMPLLNARMSWEHLPQYDVFGNEYMYRVIEVLTWYDGTVDVVNADGTYRNDIASYSQNADGNAFTVSNDIRLSRVRLAKVWNDNHGSENTRPTGPMTITIVPVGESSAAQGRTFTLSTKGNSTASADSEIYYSDYFYLPDSVALTYGVEGANYIITESFTARNGAVYTETIDSTGDHVQMLADESYVLYLINTTDTTRKVYNLTAAKAWSGDETWKDVTRPALQFKIQYYDRANGWTDITDANKAQFTNDPEHFVCVQTVDASVEWKANWNNVYKYWDTPSSDGVAEFIRYRAVEIIDNDNHQSSYTHSDQEWTSITDALTSKSVTITNTWQKQTLKIKKTWTKNGSGALTTSQVSRLVNLNAIPKTINFEVQYKDSTMSEFAPIPGTATLSYLSVNLLNAQTTTIMYPRYDRFGQEIQYRVVETSVVYANGQEFAIDWNTEMTAGSQGSFTTAPTAMTWSSTTATAQNDYKCVERTATKIWKDEDNRDGVRTDITITLNRDGSAYAAVGTGNATQQNNAICTVTKNGNTWTLRWELLPKYKYNALPVAGNESVYTWEETTGVTNYVIVYDADGPERTTVENDYQPMRGTITATKVWTDYTNQFISRPGTVYLKLQYKNQSGNFVDVPTGVLVDVNGKLQYQDPSGSKVYSTSTTGWLAVTAADSWSVQWENLPVHYLNASGSSATVVYRVVEGYMNEGGTITQIENGSKLNGYTVTYTNSSLASDGQTVNNVVTNTIDTTTLTLTQQWMQDGSWSSFTRPSSVTYVIEWRQTGDTDWQALPEGLVNGVTVTDGVSTVEVTAAGNWTKTLSGLPVKDAAGTAYEYRIIETVAHYASGDVPVNAEDSMVGPYDITAVTVNAAFANGKYTAVFTNTLCVGSLTAQKVWNDANDRDGGRKAVSVTLYRVTTNAAGNTETQALETKTLNAANGWTYTWTNLPKRNNDADELTDYCEYYILENNVSGTAFTGNAGMLYEVTQSDHTTVEMPATVTVTNKHIPLTTEITAVKNWLDANNKIDVRPTSVVFKLQYRIGTGSWTDFPAANILGAVPASTLLTKAENEVWMISADTVSKTITAEDSWTASWTGLTAYARVNGVSYAVEYRVVEDTSLILNYTAQNSGISSAVKISSASKTVTISNAPDLGSITVSKIVTANGAALSADELYELVEVLHVLPASLTVTLNYYDGPTLKTETATLTFSSSSRSYGTCTFTALPLAYANGTPVSYTVSDSVTGYAFLTCGTVGSVNVTSKTVPASAPITNSYQAGSLKASAIWNDASDRDGGRTPITVELYRDGVKIDSKVLSAANGWAFIWDNLPVYQDASATTKSVYTIKEVGETDLQFVGANSIPYSVTYSGPAELVAGSTVNTTVTNEHTPYTFSLDAAKLWEDNSDVYGLRPSSIVLTLKWATSANATVWNTLTQATVLDPTGVLVTTPSALSQTLNRPAGAAVNSWTGALWENLPAYVLVDDGHGNLVSTLVYYKVTETLISADSEAYTSTDSAAVTYLNHETVEAQVENELTGTVDVNVRKIWVDQNNRFANRPDSVTVQLQYTAAATPGESDWTNIEGAVVLLSAANSWTYTWEDLPSDFSYRVIELGVTYGTVYTALNAFVVYESAAEITAAGNTEITNTLVTGEMTAAITWDDQNNRDGGRQPIVIDLYRDGVLVDTITLNETNGWTYNWSELPVYVAGSTTKSVYSVKERGEEDGEITLANDCLYEVTYGTPTELTAGGSVTLPIGNKHLPIVFGFEASKMWNDASDLYGLRPATVKLTLVWATSADATVWNTVTQAAAPDASGLTVTSSDAPTQTLNRPAGAAVDVWTGAEWNNLPAYVLVEDGHGGYVSAPVFYKVTETFMSGQTDDYLSSDSAVVSYQNYETVDVKVANSLTGITYATVRKVWNDQDARYAVRPESVTVKLQYTTVETPAEADWLDVVGCEVLLTATSETPWEYTWMNLREDYQYRVIETGITYGTGESAHFIPVDEISGYETDSELVADSSGKLTTTVITNTLRTGSLEVFMVWEDSNNRYALRPAYVTLYLHRVGDSEPLAQKTVAVTADGVEECIFTDLPIYMDGSDEYCTYYVTEDMPEGYTFRAAANSESPVALLSSGRHNVTLLSTDKETADLRNEGRASITVTNRLEKELVGFDVTKTWMDDLNPYGLRPTAVSLKLVYAFAPDADVWTDVTFVDVVPDSATDDGILVFTTSELIQILTDAGADELDGNVWSKLIWNDLPYMALVEEDGSLVSKTVYYKVVEAEVPSSSYSMEEAGPFNYLDADEESMLHGNVVNTLTEVTELTVLKEFVDNEHGELADYMPSAVRVQLQYRASEEDEWKNVPASGEIELTEEMAWTFTFENLPNEFEYRVIETGLKLRRTWYEATHIHDEADVYTAAVCCFDQSTVTEKLYDEESGAFLGYSATVTNTLWKIPNTGDASLFVYGASLLASAGGLFVLTKKKKEEDED